MKTTVRLALLLVAGALLVVSVPRAFAQAEGVKARAKALKVRVEGTNTTATVRTNAPGARPAR